MPGPGSVITWSSGLGKRPKFWAGPWNTWSLAGSWNTILLLPGPGLAKFITWSSSQRPCQPKFWAGPWTKYFLKFEAGLWNFHAGPWIWYYLKFRAGNETGRAGGGHFPGLPPVVVVFADYLQNVSNIERDSSLKMKKKMFRSFSLELFLLHIKFYFRIFKWTPFFEFTNN